VLFSSPMTLGLARARPEEVPGVGRLGEALRAAGVCEALGAVDLGVVPAPTAYVDARDARTGIRNLPAVLENTARLAAALAPALERGDFAVLLGGDCSVLLGALAALRRSGRCGLVHLDGHTDFYPPPTSASGQVAAMELWLATGAVPAEMATPEGPWPLVDPLDAVLVGHRDHLERRRSGAPDPAERLLSALPFEEVRALGAERVGTEVREALAGRGLDGYWIHLDVDVLDADAMPAVDTPEPAGLSHAELVDLLRALSAGPARGLTVTIFDPSLDPTGALARDLVATLTAGLET